MTCKTLGKGDDKRLNTKHSICAVYTHYTKQFFLSNNLIFYAADGLLYITVAAKTLFSYSGIFYRFIHTQRYKYIQGVPRNMTIGRRLESRLWYVNLFVTFSLLSTLTCMILETIIT